jgi:hypothetical protein
MSTPRVQSLRCIEDDFDGITMIVVAVWESTPAQPGEAEGSEGENTYGHAHEGLIGLGRHFESCKKEIATRKRGEGGVSRRKDTGDGREEKEEEKREGGGRGRKIPVRGWKRMLATSAQSGRPGARTV